MKSPTLTQQQADPAEKQQAPSQRLRELDAELSAIQSSHKAAYTRIGTSEREIAGLIALSKSLQVRHTMLVDAERVASTDMKECQLDAARNFGKPSEHLCIQRLMEAEKLSDAASLALSEFLAPAPLETTQKRIQELHKSIAEDKTTLASGEQRLPQLQAERLTVLSALTKEGQIALLRSFNDVLSVIEEFGLSLAHMRTEDATAYNLLLANISLTQEDIGQLFTEDESPDGTHYIRYALNARQANVKAHLKKLQA